MVCRAAIAVIQSEMDGECGAARLCKLAARGSRQGSEALGKDDPMAAVVSGIPEDGGGARDLDAPGFGSSTVVGNLEAVVAGAAGDRD